MDRPPAARPDPISTTVTEARRVPETGGIGPLALTWLFPRSVPVGAVAGARDSGELLIGRDSACDVCLEGTAVSRRHAGLRFEPAHARLAIRDLGSRNGIRVNDRRVESAMLGRGDVVRIGGWVGIVTVGAGSFEEIALGLWGGAVLQTALAPLKAAARSQLPIVLEGETGTGKEVVTRAVHRWSGRTGPLVAVNCGALPDGLAEGELFGYRRGAFTGADRASPGLFRSAEGGTLLLDEVTDLSPAIQTKLLRVIEQREVQPLGESRPVAIDVRIVVAGQQSLLEAARQGRLRPDLVARLDGLSVRLPPLRERIEDVPSLFMKLLGELGSGWAPAMEPDLIERLCRYDWPFNVRELVSLTRRLIVICRNEASLRAEHLPERIGAAAAARDAGEEPPVKASEPVEIPALISALRLSRGNVARAAAMLGISRQRAYRLMDGGAIDLDVLRTSEEPVP